MSHRRAPCGAWIEIVLGACIIEIMEGRAPCGAWIEIAADLASRIEG